MTQPEIREYTVHGRTTDTFGRVLANARQHHFVVDGPVQNNCPGEALTPSEIFLGGVVACGVELTQVIAKENDIPLREVSAQIYGMVDSGDRVREDVMLFNVIRLSFVLRGVTDEQGAELIAGFRSRCPLIGTVSVATPNLSVEWTCEP